MDSLRFSLKGNSYHLETSVSGFPDGNLGQAFCQEVSEDLAALFNPPRKVDDSTFPGEVRLRLVAEKLMRVARPSLKQDLVTTFDSAITATGHTPLRPLLRPASDRRSLQELISRRSP